MIAFDAFFFSLALLSVVFAWIPATIYIGDRGLAPLLERFGKRHWYLSKPHLYFWYATMAMPLVCALGLILFSPAMVTAYPWLLIASLVTLICYAAVGYVTHHHIGSVESIWFSMALWPLYFIF